MKQDTYAIGRKAGATILHSARTAEAIGRPFTKLVTIRNWQLGSTPDSIFRDFADLRTDWFGDWSHRPKTRKKIEVLPANGTPTWAYVHEDMNGESPHTHWLVHIKPENEKRFKEALIKRLKSQYEEVELPPGFLRITDIYNAEGVKLYLVKGLQKRYADRWNINIKDCGRIFYRRADCSRNIGPSIWQPLKWEYLYGRRAA